MKFAAFISHHHSDAAVHARYLCDLMTLMLPSNVDVFLDADRLTNFVHLFPSVHCSEALVLVASPTVLQSAWCLLEVYEAATHGRPVVPLRLPGFQAEGAIAYLDDLPRKMRHSPQDLKLIMSHMRDIGIAKPAMPPSGTTKSQPADGEAVPGAGCGDAGELAVDQDGQVEPLRERSARRIQSSERSRKQRHAHDRVIAELARTVLRALLGLPYAKAGEEDEEDEQPITAALRSSNPNEVHDVHLSKHLTKLLRHHAVEHGVRVDGEGWAFVSDALRYINTKQETAHVWKVVEGEPVQTWTERDLREMVWLNNKKRFELRETPAGLQVRATQGHTMQLPGRQVSQRQLELQRRREILGKKLTDRMIVYNHTSKEQIVESVFEVINRLASETGRAEVVWRDAKGLAEENAAADYSDKSFSLSAWACWAPLRSFYKPVLQQAYKAFIGFAPEDEMAAQTAYVLQLALQRQLGGKVVMELSYQDQDVMSSDPSMRHEHIYNPQQDYSEILDGGVLASDTFVLLQTRNTLRRPWTLLQMYEAILAGKQLVCVYLRDGGYDFDQALEMLRNLQSTLDAARPNGWLELRKLVHGRNLSVSAMQKALFAVIPDCKSIICTCSSKRGERPMERFDFVATEIKRRCQLQLRGLEVMSSSILLDESTGGGTTSRSGDADGGTFNRKSRRSSPRSVSSSKRKGHISISSVSTGESGLMA